MRRSNPGAATSELLQPLPSRTSSPHRKAVEGTKEQLRRTHGTHGAVGSVTRLGALSADV